MEYFSCLFQFKNYRIDENRKVIVYLNHTIALSKSERYLILWKSKKVLNVYDLEQGGCYHIPQNYIAELVKNVSIQISPDEKTVMISVLNDLSNDIIWWNLETRQIIQTMNAKTSFWTVTNEHLVEMNHRGNLTLHAYDGKISEYHNGSLVPEYSFFCIPNNGEIIKVSKWCSRSEYVHTVHFHSIEDNTSRSVSLDLPRGFLPEYPFEFLQIQQYLPVYRYNEGDMFIFDMETGEPILETKLHGDMVNFINDSNEDEDYPRMMVFQKTTLIAITSMVLHLSICRDLPETLKYIVCQILCI